MSLRDWDREYYNDSDNQHFRGYDSDNGTTHWYDDDDRLDCITSTPDDDDDEW